MSILGFLKTLRTRVQHRCNKQSVDTWPSTEAVADDAKCTPSCEDPTEALYHIVDGVRHRMVEVPWDYQPSEDELTATSVLGDGEYKLKWRLIPVVEGESEA